MTNWGVIGAILCYEILFFLEGGNIFLKGEIFFSMGKYFSQGGNIFLKGEGRIAPK